MLARLTAASDLVAQAAALPARPAGANIGAYGVTRRDYAAAIANIPTLSKGHLCLILVAKAAVNGVHVNTLMNDDLYAALLEITVADAANLAPEDKAATVNSTFVHALRGLTIATNPDKKLFDARTNFNVPLAQLSKGYAMWFGESTPDQVKTTIRAIMGAFENSPTIETKLAASRLVGRGFAAAGMVASVITEVKSDAGRQAIARVFAAYEVEVGAYMGMITWLFQTRDHYDYSYYLGVPQAHGAKRYQHLVAFAIQVLDTRDLQRYAGPYKHIVFTAEITALIQAVKNDLRQVTLAAYDGAWWDAISGVQEAYAKAIAP